MGNHNHRIPSPGATAPPILIIVSPTSDRSSRRQVVRCFQDGAQVRHHSLPHRPRILGRSFMAAYKQASAASQYQRAQAKAGGSSSGGASLSSGMTLDEACKILNVKPPAGGQADVDVVLARYKRLFDAND